MDVEDKNFYELLGVDKTATREEIKRAYRDIALVYHPDSNFFDEILDDSLSESSLRIFQILTDAYNTLIDERKRKEYDDTHFVSLPDWDSESIDVDAANPESHRAAYAWGTFGTMRSSPFGVMEEDPLVDTGMEGRPVSEMLRRDHGIFGKVLSWIGLR